LHRGNTQNYQVFNIASGEGTTLLEVANLVAAKFAKSGKIIFQKSRTGEVTKYIADISRARQVLHYEPLVPIAEGLEKTVRWYQESRPW
jgi:nucleoside-diphosphate-sugar epimerase